MNQDPHCEKWVLRHGFSKNFRGYAPSQGINGELNHEGATSAEGAVEER